MFSRFIKIVFIFVFIAFGSSICLSQKSVTELKSAHATALERFLSENKDYEFMSESILGPEYLKWVQEWLEGGKPYYAAGDFNNDRIEDFAVILSRKGKVEEGGGSDFPHRYDYPLAVVIFNGLRHGGFQQPFVEAVKKPIASFIRLPEGKQKGLFFGVFETDDDWIFTSYGKGYKLKYIGL